jgi:hypothetical protein
MFLCICLIAPVNAVEVSDEYNDVLHAYEKNNRFIIETELRPHIDIIRMESVIVNETLGLILELADTVRYSNDSDYMLDFIELNIGYSYSFSWSNGSFHNSSDYLDHVIVDNRITCFFSWNTSLNESDFMLYGITFESVDYEEIWFDSAPDFFVPYLFYTFRPGFLRNPYFGRGFTYFGKNVHVSKAVNVTIIVEYQNLLNTSGGSSGSGFSVQPGKFFGGYIRTLVYPLFAHFNATIQVNNFSHSYNGIKIGSWVFITDVFYNIEQHPTVTNYNPEYGLSHYIKLKKSQIHD